MSRRRIAVAVASVPQEPVSETRLRVNGVCSQSSHERLKASSEFPRLPLVGYVDENGFAAYEAVQVRGAMRNCTVCKSTLIAWRLP